MLHAIRVSEARSLYCEVHELETVESGIRFPARGSDWSHFRLALGRRRPHIRCMLKALPTGLKRQGREADHFGLMPNSIICEVTLSLLSRLHGALLNLSNPTGHVMHRQFNIQQLYALPTLYLCVLYLSENKQRLGLLTP